MKTTVDFEADGSINYKDWTELETIEIVRGWKMFADQNKKTGGFLGQGLVKYACMVSIINRYMVPFVDHSAPGQISIWRCCYIAE